MQSSLPKLDGSFQESLQSAHPGEHAKISRLFVILTKTSNEMVRLEDLLDALIDCCHLKNGIFVHISLCMMHVVFKHSSWMRKKLTHRGNCVFTGLSSEHIKDDMYNQESFERRIRIHPPANRIDDKIDFEGATWLKANRSSTIFNPPKVDLYSLFELINQIVMADFDELVRLEAISLMNTILRSCNAYSERDKFASKFVFQTVSLLLRKEASVCLRKEAVNLFYQLLNSDGPNRVGTARTTQGPDVTTAFCCGFIEDNDGAVRAEVDAKILSSVSEFKAIVDGLVDCISCTGNCPKKLKLRRSTVTVVAYIASLGKPGIGILLNPRLPRRYCMLVSIAESVVSDLDLESLEAIQPFEVFRERTLLLREALILLNRLVSHPQFSPAVLQALTSSRDITSLTLDVAKRLCQKAKFSWQDDFITKQIRESEIAELGRLFKRRVFTFLGIIHPDG